MTSTRPRAGQQRPGGRTERVRRAVAEAVLSFIQERQLDFSYNEVAERSGVHKTTLYRRWPQRSDLIDEALKQHNSLLQIPDGGTWSQVAEALVVNLARFLSDPTEIAINCVLFADPSPEAAAIGGEYWQPVHETLKQVIAEAQQRGELPADIDPQTVLLTVLGPLLVTTLMTRAPIEEQQVQELVKVVRLYGCAQG